MDLQYRRNIRKRLREWKERNGHKLQEISQKVKPFWPTSVPSISNYMKDEKGTSPSVEFLWALGKAYPREINIDDIIYGDDAPPKPVLGQLRQLEPPDDWEADRSVTEYPDFDEASVAADLLQMEVYNADLRYRLPFDDSEPQDDPSYPLSELDRILEQLITAPFAHPEHFVTLDQLSRPERVTYVNAALVALRPLLRAFYRGERSIPQKPPNKEDAACTEVTND